METHRQWLSLLPLWEIARGYLEEFSYTFAVQPTNWCLSIEVISYGQTVCSIVYFIVHTVIAQ